MASTNAITFLGFTFKDTKIRWSDKAIVDLSVLLNEPSSCPFLKPEEPCQRVIRFASSHSLNCSKVNSIKMITGSSAIAAFCDPLQEHCWKSILNS
jgi:hypothetical protein